MQKCKTNFARRKGLSHTNTRSRSGSMLILVLVILAVSLILITSALIISMAGRQRYYENSEEQQANLTAMSAAKLIAQAASKGKITVTELESMAAANLGAGTLVNVSSIGLNIPGLANNTESNTTALFANYTGATNGKTYISVLVTTQIDAGVTGGASTEQVTLLLERIDIPSSPFNNLMTVGIEELNTNNNFYKMTVGNITGNTAPVVIHGNVIAGDSASQTFHSDMIFTGHVSFASGTDFYGDIILYGDNSSIETSGVGHGLNSLGGNVFMLRDNVDTIFTANGVRTNTNTTNINVAAGGVYLDSTIFQPEAKDVKSIAQGIVVGPDSIGPGGYIPSAATTTALTTEAEALDINILSAVSRTVLTTEQARPLFQYDTSSEVMSNAIQITPAMLAADLILNTPGSYYINLLDTIEIKNDITFDLTNGSISLYLIDTSGSARTLEIDNAIVRFINGSATNVGKILMLDGSDIKIGPKNSAPEIGIYGAASHSSPPFLFIFGLGELGAANPNTFTVENGTLECYLGLYGTSGEISIESAPTLYARYEAAFVFNLGSQNTTFPNCPAPLGGTGITQHTIKYLPAGYLVG